jgi:hypothetical protein
MMEKHGNFTANFQAGLGVVPETKLLLELYEPGVSIPQLRLKALESGLFPKLSARRLRNLVAECFAPRYMVDYGLPARCLKILLPILDSRELLQFLWLYTARSQEIFTSFILNVYWARYAEGQLNLGNDDAQRFIQRALDDGRMGSRWTDKTIRRVASYLTGASADFGFLEGGSKRTRKILPVHILPRMVVFLAYDLHLRGMGDNAVISHPDWALFGLSRDETLDELKRVSLDGHFIIQAAGEAVRIAWKYSSMEEACHGIAGR